MWNRASRRGKGYMEDQDALSWKGKRGSYSSPRNHNCCPSSLQGRSTKRINLREARTYQGEYHRCPQVGQVLTKTSEQQYQVINTFIWQIWTSLGQSSGPAFLICLLILSGLQLGSKKSSAGRKEAPPSCRGKRQISSEHEDAYGWLQKELSWVPQGVLCFASSAAVLLSDLWWTI